MQQTPADDFCASQGQARATKYVKGYGTKETTYLTQSHVLNKPKQGFMNDYFQSITCA